MWLAESSPSTSPPGEAVCIAAGDVYVAIVPLDPTDMGAGAPLRLHRDGEKLTLDIYNYLGPAKQFWEHRSQSGPFYQGNIRNAAIIEVAERGEYAGLDAFAEHIASAMVSDSVGEDRVREIAYASEGGSVSLRYSLVDMAPAGRVFDGVAYAAPVARAGATDGARPAAHRHARWTHPARLDEAAGGHVAEVAHRGRRMPALRLSSSRWRTRRRYGSRRQRRSSSAIRSGSGGSELDERAGTVGDRGGG